MISDLSAQAAHRHVWRPDVFGSVAFLVASALAWFEQRSSITSEAGGSAGGRTEVRSAN